jgi:HEAT repeat protein
MASKKKPDPTRSSKSTTSRRSSPKPVTKARPKKHASAPSAEAQLQQTTSPQPAEPSAEVQRLIAQLRDAVAEVARDAASALGEHRDAGAVAPLIDVLDNRDGYFHLVARCAAATALGQIADQRAIDSLIAALRDPMAEISVEAATALGNIRDDRAIPALIEVAGNASGYFLWMSRRAAIRALGNFAHQEAQMQLRQIADNRMDDDSLRDEARSAMKSNA